MVIPSTAELTIPEKQLLLRKRRSGAEKVRRQAIKDSGMTEVEFDKTLKPGAGKGMEPKPWCDCHNRNPCPIDKELGLI